jgi:putative NADH-flavin reductase
MHSLIEYALFNYVGFIERTIVMRLFLLGATGIAGRAILSEALERGHSVTAYVRAPNKISQDLPNLTVVQGNALDYDCLASYMVGHDAVVSSLDAQTLKCSPLQNQLSESVRGGMEMSGVVRLLILSVAFLFENAGLATFVLGRTIFRQVRQGSGELERVIQESSLDWTIVRLPRLLDSLSPKIYRTTVGQAPPAITISSGALASFLMDEVLAGKFVRRVVGVSG